MTAVPAARHRVPREPLGKVVVTSTYPVYPHAFGGSLRSFHLFGAMAQLCDVEIVSLSEPGRPMERVEIAEGFVETVVPRSAKQARLETEANVRSGGFVGDVLAATLTTSYTPAYLDALRRALDGAAAAIVAQPFLLPCVRAVAPRLPFAYDAQNVELRLKSSLVSDATDTMLALVREVEAEAVAESSVVFVCSGEDRETLTTEYATEPSRVVVVPNGVDTDTIAYVAGPERRDNERVWIDAFRRSGGWADAERMALFLGSDHMPNQEAVAHLLNVLPDIDGVLVAVAGWVGLPFLDHGPSSERAAFLGPFTEDTKRVLLSSAAVGLNPVTRGSGTNLKVLEYFAAGIPVVSTSQGARGLDVVNGVHLVVAAATDVVPAITGILEDPDGAAALAERARRLAEQRYSWSVVSKPACDWVRRQLA